MIPTLLEVGIRVANEPNPVVDKTLIIKLMGYPTPHPNARE